MFIRSDGDNDEASVGMNELALADSEWISPPVSIRSASAEASTEAGLADSFGRLDVTEPISGGSGSHGKRDDSNFFCSSVAEVLESLHGKTDLDNNQVIDIYAFCHDDISCFPDDTSCRAKDISFFLIRRALL